MNAHNYPDMERSMLSVKELRENFALNNADQLAASAGLTVESRLPLASSRSTRFVWYRTKTVLGLVVGPQEEGKVDEALAVGLGERDERQLVLVLPLGWHEPSLHRSAWLRPDLDLQIWTHNGTDNDSAAVKAEVPDRPHTLAVVQSLEKLPLHLGKRTPLVEDLMTWAGEHKDLDASHTQASRAWQCRGQRVLVIHSTKAGLSLVAGIDWGPSSPNQTPLALAVNAKLSDDALAAVKADIEAGIQQRMSGVANKDDEHWLQAVLRRHPKSLGLEQPVLRELPAWRPQGSKKKGLVRGRGFVDLAGLDATGRLLLVETKLGSDDMLVLQGLDYYIWANANRDRLTTRLDCRSDVEFEISYCVGGEHGKQPQLSRHAQGQLNALAPEIRWHVQQVSDWVDDHPKSKRSPLRQLPAPPPSKTGPAVKVEQPV